LIFESENHCLFILIHWLCTRLIVQSEMKYSRTSM